MVMRLQEFRQLLFSPLPHRPSLPVQCVKYPASECFAAKGSQGQASWELTCSAAVNVLPKGAGGMWWLQQGGPLRKPNILFQDWKNWGVISPSEPCLDQAGTEPSSSGNAPFLGPSLFPILLLSISHLLLLGGFPQQAMSLKCWA